MHQTDARMDELALQVGDIQKNMTIDENGDVEVGQLLQSVSEVRSNYQNLRKEISEVQDLQRQLSSSLQLQIRVMQSKFAHLKEKIQSQAPEVSLGSSIASSLDQSHQFQHIQHVNCVSDLSLNDDGGFGAYLSKEHMPVPAMQAPVPNLLMDVPEVPLEKRFRHF